MEGQDVFEFSFKRRHQATTLGSKTALTINKEAVHIDSQALFQRLTVVATHDNVDGNEVFKHERCSYPTALLKPRILQEKPTKQFWELHSGIS